MRIVLDLQVAQCCGIQHPVGRQAVRFAQALQRVGGGHELILLLNDAYPASVEELRALFASQQPAPAVEVVAVPSVLGHWEEQVAAQLRELVVDRLQPEVIHAVAPFDTNGAFPSLIPPLFSNPGPVASIALPAVPAFQLHPGSAVAVPRQVLVEAQALKRADLVCCRPSDGVLFAAQLHIPQDRFLFLDIFDPNTATRQRMDQAASAMLEAWQRLWQSRQPLQRYYAARRLSLAYLSPLPPLQSGIADYSAELLPELARYYDITLVTDQPEVSAPWLSVLFPVRPVVWFEQHSSGFDRILYHVGNSPYHSHMFGLLERHPGAMVLHDVFLSDIIDHLQTCNGDPGGLQRVIYDEQGFTPLLSGSADKAALLGQYLCSLQIIRRAAGVLVHSRFASSLLEAQYGSLHALQLQQVPFIRLPLVLPDRSEARARLGVPPETFLVCSFGILSPAKLCHRLLAAWQASGLGSGTDAQLYFVGSDQQGEYAAELAASIRSAGCSGSVIITGFIPPETYRTYLAAADLAVQLREYSRGETSASVYDCLAAGLPLICNAHGSNAELPEECVFMLPDRFEDGQLIQALKRLQADPAIGIARAEQATAWLLRHHHPAQVALHYCQAIEYSAATVPRSHERRLATSLSPPLLPEQEAVLAAVLAANRPPCGLRQLLLDISAIVQHDLKTGIQRVVRSIMRQLLLDPPPGYRIEPVCYDGRGGYRYARRFTLRTLGLDEELLEDAPVQAGAGDLFIGADLVFGIIPAVAKQLRNWHAHGVQISFIVYDLLPIQRPDCFPTAVEGEFRAWLATVASVADRLVCISRAVADELLEHLRYEPPQRRQPPQVGFFHLGADINASLPTAGLPDNAEQTLQAIASAPAFLMVGTIEPRKGHTQTLDAFELLWRQGVEAHLVIVGKPGWMTEGLIERLDAHPEKGKQLFCLYRISDQMLEQVYGVCSCLLAPSEGEGFGLPLIEAAQHGLPLIVRDIPVFREVAGPHAAYFAGAIPEDLARVIAEWLQQPVEARPASTGMPWLTWQQSVAQLLETISLSSAESRQQPNLLLRH